MDNSGFGFKNLSDKNKTTGYAIFSTTKKKEGEVYDAPGPYAAGAIYSTVGDLYKFHMGLKTATIIQRRVFKKSLHPC